MKTVTVNFFDPKKTQKEFNLSEHEESKGADFRWGVTQDGGFFIVEKVLEGEVLAWGVSYAKRLISEVVVKDSRYANPT